MMYSRYGLCLLCLATLLTLNRSASGGKIATSMIEFTGDWQGWQLPPPPDRRSVSWAISLIPNKHAPGADTTTDVELQFAFEFARDLLDTPTLNTDRLTSLPATNPYTGEITEGLSVHYDVPSQLGRDGNVNVMFLSFTGTEVSMKDDALRLSFTSDGGDGIFYNGTFVVGETTHSLRNSFGVGSAALKFGDSNIDGTINGLDIDDMIRALGDNTAWEARHPGSDILEYLDGNVDGKVNNLDIYSYVGALQYPPFLVATNPTSVPESTALNLVTAACASSTLLGRYLSSTRCLKSHQP